MGNLHSLQTCKLALVLVEAAYTWGSRGYDLKRAAVT